MPRRPNVERGDLPPLQKRLHDLMNREGIDVEGLADRIGMSRSGAYKLVFGSGASKKTLEAISRTFSVSIDWLTASDEASSSSDYGKYCWRKSSTGWLLMAAAPDTQWSDRCRWAISIVSPEEWAGGTGRPPADLLDRLDTEDVTRSLLLEISTLSRVPASWLLEGVESPGFRLPEAVGTVPVRIAVPPGGPLEADDRVLMPAEQLAGLPDQEHLRAWRVSDTAMAPAFAPGDLVLLDAGPGGRQLVDRAVVLVAFPGGPSLCRLRRAEAGWLVETDRPDDLLEPLDDAPVVGRVVWSGGRL